MLLVNISQFYRFAYFKVAAIGLFQSHDEPKQGGLARTIRANHTHNAVGRKHEVQVVEKHFLAKCLLYMLCFDNLVAQARTVGDEYLQLLFTFLLLLSEHLFVGVETRLALGLSGLRCHVGPFQFSFKSLSAF